MASIDKNPLKSIDASRTKDRSIILVCIILVQMVLVLASAGWTKLFDGMIGGDFISYFLGIVTVPIGLIGLYVLWEIIRLGKRDAEASLAEARLEDSKAMVSVLRTQRHDFLNHIQVIYGLIQLNKLDNAKSYIQNLTGEMESFSRITSLAVPEVTALLMKKKAEAYRKGITLEVEALTDLQGVGVPGSDLVGIVGNIVDNAFHSLDDEDCTEKDVTVTVNEREGIYLIRISNNGPPIPEAIRGKIFEEGFSTNGEEGRGFGLAIVKRLVQKYGGKIKVDSGEEGTTFEVEFRKAG